MGRRVEEPEVLCLDIMQTPMDAATSTMHPLKDIIMFPGINPGGSPPKLIDFPPKTSSKQSNPCLCYPLKSMIIIMVPTSPPRNTKCVSNFPSKTEILDKKVLLY
jgi:hypothetical protein